MSWIRTQVKKSLNPRTFVLLLFLAGVLLWIRSLDVTQRMLRAKNQAAAAARAAAVPAPPRPSGRTLEASMSALTPPGWGGDPFERRVLDTGERPDDGRATPRAAKAAAQSGLYLQGIMNGPLGRTALINGDIYREGQRIGAREVIQIGRRSVMVLDRGNVITLTLKGEGS